MEWLRRALHRLGWPVDSMPDDAIASELCRRWVAESADHCLPQCTGNVAAATGVFASMARSGNLDALCWSEEDDVEFLDEFTANKVNPLKESRTREQPEEEGYCEDRRRSRRIPASDLVSLAESPRTESSGGWLVDVSSEGIAFMAETRDVPVVGTRITPKIHGRRGETIEVGPATVVHTELLNESLSLVGARLDRSWEPGR